MGLDGFLYNGMPQARSFFVFAPGQVCLIEPFPDLAKSAAGDADAVVFDGDGDLLPPLSCFNGDGGYRVA